MTSYILLQFNILSAEQLRSEGVVSGRSRTSTWKQEERSVQPKIDAKIGLLVAMKMTSHLLPLLQQRKNSTINSFFLEKKDLKEEEQLVYSELTMHGKPIVVHIIFYLRSPQGEATKINLHPNT